MKKTYKRPTIHTYHITPTPLLTVSDGLNVNNPNSGNAANAASREYNDDDEDEWW